MLAISVIADTASHLRLLRAALNGLGLQYELMALDTDLGSLCHFRTAATAPDFIFVNGELPICETPEFIKDLLAIPLLARTRVVVLGPLDEDRPELAALGVLLLARKPLQVQELRSILQPS